MSEERNIATIPENVPAYLATSGLAREMNADAAAGIGTGFPPSIRIKNGKFRLVDGAGEETVLKAADLKESTYLDMVVLRAKAGLNKVWYAKPYDPAAEASAPDCFSLDGVKPDPSIQTPQCSTCAACPKNAWGSGRNQSGEATKGKACADNKILAVLHKGGVYQFKIPPASLKNWGVFVKNLSARDIPLGAVIVYVSFDDESDFSVLQFRVGNFVPESAIPKLMEYANSPETDEIISPIAPANPPAAQPGREIEEPAKTESVKVEDDLFGGDENAKEPAKAEPAATDVADLNITALRARASELKIKGRSKMDADDLADAIADAEADMGQPDEPQQQAEKPAEVKAAASNDDVPSDDDIAESLGL